jgi:hypothetical protein
MSGTALTRAYTRSGPYPRRPKRLVGFHVFKPPSLVEEGHHHRFQIRIKCFLSLPSGFRVFSRLDSPRSTLAFVEPLSTTPPSVKLSLSLSDLSYLPLISPSYNRDVESGTGEEASRKLLQLGLEDLARRY